ncbi:hypothetical protein [Salinimicrobium sp. HB62]|uniref:hypothetical protein n=1 Tax=Salinimicrobium sp. HB62 TaxID=3077781 RepID=UPI002D7A0A7F|nr:hypothetical protein [Salinimicrobium sp. HB62]
MADKKILWNRIGRGYSSPENSESTKETTRKDWGYTDQYRRMMQRDFRKKRSSEIEKEI